MAAANGGRTLEETPTWAVAVVCFVLVGISIAIEHIIHLVGKWLKKRNKSALYEALEKIKAELMLLGFISLLLTVGQQPISGLCVSKAIGATWHPCNKKQENKYLNQVNDSYYNGQRKLLTLEDSGESHRRVLATAGDDKCAKKGQVAFVSTFGIHQLHIFIFVLALSHVLYCITNMVLGQIKMRKWKSWEMETRTTEYLFSHDPERFRFTRDTSFGRRHLNYWSHTTILVWITSFFRQFIRSISKVDYFTLRHGFIVAHLAPQSQSNFDFQKYIQRSLEEDFKVLVGISPVTWLFAVIFLLFNTHGLFSYLWLPFIPLIIILLVGTKLQVIITQMGLRIQDRGEVIKGTPVVHPGDELFWFNRPRLLLHLIHFVLFQNAFQLAFFAWAWYEFGLKSCFHENVEDIVIRLTMGVLVQILCSYATLPLYALVTQMGSTMKPTIFNEKVAKALRNWHHTAKKHLKESRQSGSVNPLPSRPTTPLHGTSPINLLRHYRSEMDSAHTTPRISNFDNEFSEAEGSVSPSHRHQSSNHVPAVEQEREGQVLSSMHSAPQDVFAQHEISIRSARFSFDTGPKI